MRIARRTLTAAVGVAVMAGLVPGAQATPAATQENVRLVTNVPGSTGGHAVAQGDRLYVGAYGLGMTIFDIKNPASPVKIGEYKPALGQGGFTPSAGDPGLRADTGPDAAVFDGRDIVTLNGTSRAAGTQQTEFLDVTNPAAPRLLWRFSGGEGEAHNGDIVDARRLWMPSGSGGGNSVRIYDMNPLLQNPPAAPAKLFSGNIQTLWVSSPYRGSKPAGGNPSHIHDLEVYTDYELLLPQAAWVDKDGDGVADPTYGKRDIALYAASQSYPLTVGPGTTAPSSAVYILDITNPAEPVVINKVPARIGHRYMHEAQFLQGDPRILFASDEDLHNGCDAGGVYSWRLSDDLTEATPLDSWFNGTGTPAPVCSAHVFSSNGNYVFMGSYQAGLQVIDFSDPANLKRAGQYIAEGANSWGALYYRGYVYVGDFGARGLDVLEFIANPVAKGYVKAFNPTTRTTGGIAETGCRQGDPYGPTNGTDGLIVPIPASASDGKHKLRALGTSEAPYDLDIWFHTDNCTSMGFAGGTDGRDAVETIPEGATMASIDLYTGPSQMVYAQIVP